MPYRIIADDDMTPGGMDGLDCETLWGCYKYVFAYGFRAGGGVGEVMFGDVGDAVWLHLTFFLVVTVAMLKVYVDASRMYRFNEGLARVQENGRFALEFIRRDARVAGFWGCYSDATLTNGVSATSNAYINVGAGHITGTSDDGLNSSDSITFRSATGSGALVTSGMSGTGDNVTVESVGALSTDTAVLISDCEDGDLFQVTGIAGTALAHAAGANANVSPNLNKAYAAGARVYEAREVTLDSPGKTNSANT